MPLQGEFPGPEGGAYRLKNFEEASDPGAGQRTTEADYVVEYNSHDDMPVGPERAENGAILLGQAPVTAESTPASAEQEPQSVDGARDSVTSAFEGATAPRSHKEGPTDNDSNTADTANDTDGVVDWITEQTTDESAFDLSIDDAHKHPEKKVILDDESMDYLQRRRERVSGTERPASAMDASEWLDAYESDGQAEESKEPTQHLADEPGPSGIRENLAAKWSDSTPEKLTRNERYAVAESAKGVGRAALWTARRTMESFDDGLIRKTSDVARQGLNARFDKVVAPPHPPVKVTRETDAQEDDTMDAEKYARTMDTYNRRERSLHRNDKKILDDIDNGEDVDGYNAGKKRADIASELRDNRNERWSAMRRQPRGADSVEFHDKDLGDMNEMYQENQEQQARNQKLTPRNNAERGDQRKDAQALKRQQDRILKAVEGRNPDPVARAGGPIDRGPGNLFSREGIQNMWNREGYGSTERRIDRVVGPRTADAVRRGGRAVARGLVNYSNNQGFRGNSSEEEGGGDNAPVGQAERQGQDIAAEVSASPPISQTERLGQDIAVVRSERSEIQANADAAGRILTEHELGRMDTLSSRLSDLATQQQMLIANDKQREEEPVAG